MWDDFKCTKSAPKVPRALEKARALEKPPTVQHFFMFFSHYPLDNAINFELWKSQKRETKIHEGTLSMPMPVS